mgnify:CR=1 FL=1
MLTNWKNTSSYISQVVKNHHKVFTVIANEEEKKRLWYPLLVKRNIESGKKVRVRLGKQEIIIVWI